VHRNRGLAVAEEWNSILLEKLTKCRGVAFNAKTNKTHDVDNARRKLRSDSIAQGSASLPGFTVI
jgi:hypothetical protein